MSKQFAKTLPPTGTVSTRWHKVTMLATVFLLSGIAAAAAQTTTAPTPQAPESPASAARTWISGLRTRDTLLGDMGGLRPALARAGISLGIQDTDEVLGNVTGGLHQGAAYDGLTQMTLQLDTEKAFGWAGGLFNASALQIRGRDLSTDNLGVLQLASGIEAEPATRLWELWYQQSFLGNRANVRVGEQSIDQEFMVSKYALLFVNTVMGWPALPGADLYAGGPAYPLSSLGVRLSVHPTNAVTVLAGVFDDNPPGGPFADDPQSVSLFSLRTGALLIGEAQYAVNQAEGSRGLPGTYKIGFWYDTASFPDQRFDASGLSLADPDSNGIAAMHRGDYSFYAIGDQMVWRAGPQSPRALSVFLRAMAAPSDRNLVSFSLNAGVTLTEPLAGRDDDTFGIGFGLAKVSSQASALDRDFGLFSGSASLVRGTESFLEVTYQAQITPWWQLQPDFQYFFNPGGGTANPAEPGQRIANEAVFGLRSIVTF